MYHRRRIMLPHPAIMVSCYPFLRARSPAHSISAQFMWHSMRVCGGGDMRCRSWQSILSRKITPAVLLCMPGGVFATVQYSNSTEGVCFSARNGHHSVIFILSIFFGDGIEWLEW